MDLVLFIITIIIMIFLGKKYIPKSKNKNIEIFLTSLGLGIVIGNLVRIPYDFKYYNILAFFNYMISFLLFLLFVIAVVRLITYSGNKNISKYTLYVLLAIISYRILYGIISIFSYGNLSTFLSKWTLITLIIVGLFWYGINNKNSKSGLSAMIALILSVGYYFIVIFDHTKIYLNNYSDSNIIFALGTVFVRSLEPFLVILISSILLYLIIIKKN